MGFWKELYQFEVSLIKVKSYLMNDINAWYTSDCLEKNNNYYNEYTFNVRDSTIIYLRCDLQWYRNIWLLQVYLNHKRNGDFGDVDFILYVFCIKMS